MIDGYLLPLLQWTNRAYYQFVSDFDTVQKSVQKNMKTISELDLPTTIIRWVNDPILVASEQISVLQKLLEIPDEKIHVLKNATHFIQEEASDEIVEILNTLQ